MSLEGEIISLQLVFNYTLYMQYKKNEDRSGRVRMVIGYTTTYAISAYHH